MYWHVVIALLTYHLSSVSNLHLILANLLGLMCVRGLGSQVLVSITDYTAISNYHLHYRAITSLMQ